MNIAENLKKIRSLIPASVTLIAVSKKQPAELIEEAYLCGQRDFGENYVQELVEKKKTLSHLADIRWHLIGPLQRNKVKHALEAADFFHALDSKHLAQALSKTSIVVRKKPFPVFIQVNIDESSTKHGATGAQTSELVEEVLSLPGLVLTGLMCIPSVENTEAAFRKMKTLKAKIEGDFSLTTPLALSQGMSEDYEIAIQYGATHIRVGTRIFGARPTKLELPG